MESLLDLGYDDERFENAVDEDFHCAICMNVLKEPVMCQNNQHYFCKACITRHLHESKMCPTCREELSVETLRAPARLLMNCLSKLNIRCDNHERGCLGFVKLEGIKTHVLNCGFAPVKCSNDGCSIEVNKRDRIYHETEVCEFRRVKCHDCAEMKKEIEEVKKSVKEVKDNQEKMMKELRSLSEVKEMLEEMKATNIVKEGVEIQPSRGSAHASGVNSTIADIIIAGGEGEYQPGLFKSLDSVEMFSWHMKMWVPLTSMKQYRTATVSFVHGNKMIVAGGESSKWVFVEEDYCMNIASELLDDMEQMILNDDQRNRDWLSFPAKLPQKLFRCTCVSFEDRLILVGGRLESGHGARFENEPSDAIYEVLLHPPYTSKLLSRLPQELSDHGAERFNDGILIVGGLMGSNTCDSVVLYDVTRKVCKQMPPLPYAVSGMATVTYGEYIIVIGGSNDEEKELNTVIMYNMSNGRSKMLPSMRYKREGCTAVVTGNVIVVMGGRAPGDVVLNSVEYYSFDTNVWQELPPMNECRFGATSIVKSV